MRKSAAALAVVAAVAGVAIGYQLGHSTTSSRSGATSPSLATSAPRATPTACRLDLAHLRVHGCPLVKSDTSAAANPVPLWGRLDCANASRHQRLTSGGDPLAMGDGAAQGNAGYRRLTVIDGDQVFGERCELGLNDYRRNATFTLYREGQHRITFLSLRLPADFPLSTRDWQVVMQMKQTQPADNNSGTPVLALQAQANRWVLYHSASVEESGDTVQLWSAPATKGTWTRFAFDVVYSQQSTVGKIKVYADLNGDGDALDPGEQSPLITTYTLKRELPAETNPDDNPLKQGDSIPSHLRVGVYHHDTIACPAPGGCPVDVDNVEVYAVP